MILIVLALSVLGISKKHYWQCVKDCGEIDWECSKCSQQQVPSPKRDVSMFALPFNSTWAQHLPDDEQPRLTEVSS